MFCLAIPVGIAPTDVQGFDVGEVFKLASALSGYKLGAAAIDMFPDMTPQAAAAALSRQLSGMGPDHLSLHRVSRIRHARFWLAFVFFLGRAAGIWEGWEPLLDGVMRGRLKMARASLAPRAQEKERVSA
jgi:hypothetical protein